MTVEVKPSETANIAIVASYGASAMRAELERMGIRVGKRFRTVREFAELGEGAWDRSKERFARIYAGYGRMPSGMMGFEAWGEQADLDSLAVRFYVEPEPMRIVSDEELAGLL